MEHGLGNIQTNRDRSPYCGFLFYTVSPTAPLTQAAREYALSFAFTFFASAAEFPQP